MRNGATAAAVVRARRSRPAADMQTDYSYLRQYTYFSNYLEAIYRFAVFTIRIVPSSIWVIVRRPSPRPTKPAARLAQHDPRPRRDWGGHARTVGQRPQLSLLLISQVHRASQHHNQQQVMQPASRDTSCA